MNDELVKVCLGGSLEAVKRFVAESGMTPADVLASGALRTTCVEGLRDIAIWLTLEFNLAEAARVDGRLDIDVTDALREVCEIGILGVARWLVPTFGITLNDLREFEYDEAIFVYVCRKGMLSVAQWFAAEFKLTAADIRAYGDLHCGDKQVVEWLASM
jgi:hypothetical protein